MEIGSSAFVHEKDCPVCGKHFAMSRIDLWAYKRQENHQDNYFCSWSCLRAYDKQKEESKVKGRQPALTKDQRDHAVNLALRGYSPISYIRSCGAESPINQWGMIRNVLKDNDPERFEQLPKTIKGLPEPPACGETEEDDEPEAEETEPAEQLTEPPKITQPTCVCGKIVRAIEGECGTYHRSQISGKDWIDFESKDADELSMTVEGWRKFIADLKECAAILGVKL